MSALVQKLRKLKLFLLPPFALLILVAWVMMVVGERKMEAQK